MFVNSDPSHEYDSLPPLKNLVLALLDTPPLSTTTRLWFLATSLILKGPSQIFSILFGQNFSMDTPWFLWYTFLMSPWLCWGVDLRMLIIGASLGSIAEHPAISSRGIAFVSVWAVRLSPVFMLFKISFFAIPFEIRRISPSTLLALCTIPLQLGLYGADFLCLMLFSFGKFSNSEETNYLLLSVNISFGVQLWYPCVPECIYDFCRSNIVCYFDFC